MVDQAAPQRQRVIRVKGMHCAACVGRVERGLKALPGVGAVTVHLLEGQARIEQEGDVAVSDTALAEALDRLGFALDQAEDEDTAAGSAPPPWWPVVLALSAAVATMAVMFIAPGLVWLQWLTASVVVACGMPMLLAGARSLLRFAPDMHALVFMGVSVAWLVGTLTMLVPAGPWAVGGHHGSHHLWFDAAAWITALVLLGRRLEAGARAHLGDALQALWGMVPEAVTVVDEDGAERTCARDALQLGMRLRLRPGDRVAADARIIRGRSEVDEALLSGESLPVLRAEGDLLASGSSLLSGTVDAEIEAIGSSSTLGRIAEQVRAAQASRAPIARLADRIAGIFVPIVVVIAVLSFFGWLSFGAAILGPDDPTPGVMAMNALVSVLVIACPCALGLATPAAMVVGMGQMARAGVLVRDAATLERLAGLRAVAFDKTGTLTTGEMRVRSVDVLVGEESAVLAAVAAVEQGSQHPLARALMALAAERGVSPQGAEDFHQVPGRGVGATVSGERVLIGNQSWMVDHGCAVSDGDAEDPPGVGRVWVAIGSTVVATIAVADSLRDEAKEVVTALGAEGLSCALLSGDGQQVVEGMAAQSGIALAHGDLLPADKVQHLNSLPQPVAFVGDGINDAPALAASSVGVAIGSGTQVAMGAAAVVLPSPDLRGMLAARRISKQTMTCVRQNLFFAFVYNVAAIPLAAGLWYPWTGWLLSPGIAAAAMGLSSLSVVGNALRLRWNRF